ncbi:MAG: N-acetylmuramoyl-L-alanine amidase [Caulobacterales bacterium]
MATWIGAAAANFNPGRPAGFQPEAVVIHIMDGFLTGTDNWFNDPKAKVSAHYGVGKDGTVHQYVKETDTAFHAGIVDRPSWPLIKPKVNPNFYTIGVEHEGFDAVPYPWPAPQLAASLALVAQIADRWNIARDADHIIPHHQIRFAKTCPGEHFDQADYVARLAGAAAAPAFQAAPANLTVKALSPARVRSQPTTASSIIHVLAAGDSFVANSVVRAGEIVSGNGLWYGGAAGYLWAGATDRPAGV